MIRNVPIITHDNFKPLAIVIKAEVKQEPKLYTIKQGDSLTSISESQKSTVDRLWRKNTQLTDPNRIEVGQALTIPTEDEALADRPLPAPVLVQPTIIEQPVTNAVQYVRGN